MSKSEEIAARFNRFVMSTYAPTLTLVKGKGTKVWDADGKVYLDLSAGISVSNVGHCHPRVVEAIQRQSAELIHTSNLYYTDNQAKLAERLSRLGPGGKCFFSNSGAEANEALIKLARLWGNAQGRFEIISMKNSFHGRTLATVAATGQEKIQKGFEPMPEGFRHAPYNDLEAVAALITDKTAAVLVEAVQGEGGVIPASDGYLKGLRALCDEKGILLFCDEVQCGMGRTGNWFGYQASGIQVDGCSLAKGLGGGFPIGATISNAKLADVFKPGNHASTFGGSPLACAAALATLDAIEEDGLVRRASVAGNAFTKRLGELVEKYEHVTEVRGRGLMIGIVLDQPAKPLTEMLREMGLLTLATAENVVRLLPPLNVKDSELDEAFDIIDEALAEWHGVGGEAEGDATENA